MKRCNWAEENIFENMGANDPSLSSTAQFIFSRTEFRIGLRTKFVAAHPRFVPASQRSLGREDMAEGTCSFTVVSPLSVFLALRGPPLKMQEDTCRDVYAIGS